MSCDDCEEFYKRRYKEPPCQECMPELLPENITAWMVYATVQNQYIMGSAGPIDVNINSVKTVMDLHGVTNQQEVLERVLHVSRHMIKRMHDKQKSKPAIPRTFPKRPRIR